MKLQSLIATALAVTMGSAILAQNPAEKTKPTMTEKATAPRLDCFGDPLPAGAIARLGTVRFRHNGTIDCFTFSPDGKTIASSSGGTTHLWDVATGREVWRVEPHSTEWEVVTALAFSRDGKLLACGGGRGEVGLLVLRDAATGKQRRLLDGKEWCNYSVAFAPDGKTLASAGSKVRLWNVQTGAELHCLEGSSRVAFSPDGNILASAGKEGRGPVRLWNPRTGKQVASLPIINEEQPQPDPVFGTSINRFVFSADGKTLAVGSRTREPKRAFDTIVLWDIAAAKEVRSFVRTASDHYTFEAFGLSRDCKLIAAPSADGPVILWDTTTGKNVARFPNTQNGSYGVALSPDGKILACADARQTIHLWDPLTGKPIRPLDAPVGYGVVISPDGRTAASPSVGSVRLWDTATGKQSGAIEGYYGTMVMMPGKSPRLALQGHLKIVLYDIASKTQEQIPGGGERFAFADGGRLLFGGHWDGAIRVREVEGNKALRYFWGHTGSSGTGGVLALAPSADGKVLASAAFDGILVWDVEGRGEHPAFRDKKITGTFVALTPDGRTLAAHDGSDTVHFWDIATSRKLRSSPGRTGLPSDLAFAPDGRTLAEGRTDGTIRLLETATGGERRILSGHRGKVASLAWSADGRILISASIDTTALVWDATGLSSDPPPAKKLSPAELESLWSDLAGPATSKTHRAVWMLASNPEQAIPFLRERVRPVSAVDPKVIDRLLVDLNSANFAVRDKASRELRKLSETAEPAMRKVLAGKPPVELRRRVEELLASLAEWLPEELRALRAIEALEHMDSPDAEKLLKALATGSTDARLTREAKASLKSLSRRHAALGKAAAPKPKAEVKEAKLEYMAGDWVSLFNGKDLTDWKIAGTAEAFAVNETERAIMAKPSPKVSLLQTSRDYADFHLRFEFRIASKNANSGVNIRQPFNPTPRYQMEVQILDDSSPYKGAQTGSLYWSKNNSSHFKRERDDLLKPFGEWNAMEIIAKGSIVRVIVNGKQALNADLATVAAERNAHAGVTLTSGYIAFQADRGLVPQDRSQGIETPRESLKMAFPWFAVQFGAVESARVVSLA